MGTFIAVLTYVAYIFIVAMYTVKAVQWFKMPVHLRWDLYPVIHENNYKYGGSYYEEKDWWTKTRHKNLWRSLGYALKDNFYLGEYFKRDRGYWYVLYPWHLSFILIITFHILCFFGGIAMYFGLAVTPDSPSAFGRLFYYTIFLSGVPSFILGTIGSIGLLFRRLSDEGLRLLATPMNFFNYGFFTVVFFSGFYAWAFVDPNFAEYLAYWKGLVTWKPIELHGGAAAHIIFFMLFLIYLPFTRSFHYISRLFAYFFIRWEDEPNLKGSRLEKKIEGMLGQRVTWAGPHIQTGKTWAEVATEVKFPEKKEAK
jgi:nitrate reductase gamma subunit